MSVSDDELRRDAREIAGAKLGFYVHLAGYAIVNSIIFISWWFSGAVYIWIFPWFVFPLLGWGAGILVHYICVFAPYSSLGYIETKSDQEYQKLKRREHERQEDSVTA